MPDIVLSPGAAQVILSSPGQTLTVCGDGKRFEVKSSGTALSVKRFPVDGTPVQFVTALGDMTVDVLEVEPAVRYWPLTYVKNLSRKTRPLTVRFLPGCVFDGQGSSGGLFHFNTLNGPLTPSTPVEDIVFEGKHEIRNYVLGSSGLIMTGWVNRFGYHDVVVRNVTGTGNQSHGFYVNVGHATLRAKNVSGHRWDFQSNKTVSALHFYHEPNGDFFDFDDWVVRGANRAAYLYSTATGINLRRWKIYDSTVTIDTEDRLAKGVVTGCAAVNSGSLAPGLGRWLGTGVTSGGGNTSI